MAWQMGMANGLETPSFIMGALPSDQRHRLSGMRRFLSTESLDTADIEFRAVIMDLSLIVDVVTPVGNAMRSAVESLFERYLPDKVQKFDWEEDYLKRISENSRMRIKACLESRNLQVDFGSVTDNAKCHSICGVDAAYRVVLNQEIRAGIQKQAGIELVRTLKAYGVKIGVVTACHHGRDFLRSAGILGLFDSVVDSAAMERFALQRMPSPDSILKSCGDMGVSPYETVLIQPYGSRGCEAGVSASFALVIGVPSPFHTQDFGEQTAELYREGADRVVELQTLEPEIINKHYKKHLSDDLWKLSYRAFNPNDERLREVMTSIGNGYIGNRGCFEGEKANKHHYPSTYIAALYNTNPSVVEGRTIHNSDMVNIPNWCLVQLKICDDGDFTSPFAPGSRIIDYSHYINFREGGLERSILFEDPKGRQTMIKTFRMASMHAYHVAAIKYTVIPWNYNGKITLRSTIDGDVINDNVPRYRDLSQTHIHVLSAKAYGTCNGVMMTAETINTNQTICLYAKHSLWANGEETKQGAPMHENEKEAGATWSRDVIQGRSYCLEKVVSIFTSLDAEFQAHPLHNDPIQCIEQLASSELTGIQYCTQLLDAHRRVWGDLWHKIDIIVDGDPFVQQMIRAHSYHLLITASQHRCECL